jgi:hypothetical protein
LLHRVAVLFLRLMPRRSKNRQIELTPTRVPRSPNNVRIFSQSEVRTLAD